MPAKVTQIVRSISCLSIRGFLIPFTLYTPGFDHAMTNLALEFANSLTFEILEIFEICKIFLLPLALALILE